MNEEANPERTDELPLCGISQDNGDLKHTN